MLVLPAFLHLCAQFRRAYRRNDKPVCKAVVTFLAHLVNQQVAHEIVALQLLTVLLEKPTDDSVELTEHRACMHGTGRAAAHAGGCRRLACMAGPS